MGPELAAIAADQDGLLTLRQLRRSGLTEWGIRRLVRDRLERVCPGVYAVIGAPDTRRRRLRLGLLTLGPDAVVSFEAAAALHHLDRSDSEALEFTVPRGQHQRGHELRRLGVRLHSSRFLPRGDVVSTDGMRVTSATRTILDLALARRPLPRIEAAIDSSVRLGLSSPSAIAERVQTLRGRGRWGCRTIDRLLQDSGGHSPLERRFLRLVREAGLPRPTTQVIHRKDGRHVARVDFLFEQHGLVVEVTGRLGHSSPSERARDAQRRNELQDLGRTVYEFTFEHVVRRPDWVRRRLEEYLVRTRPSPRSTPSATSASPDPRTGPPNP